MYYRQKKNIIRTNMPKKYEIEEYTEDKPVKNEVNNSSSKCGNLPIWALILIILSLFILGICLIVLVWKK